MNFLILLGLIGASIPPDGGENDDTSDQAVSHLHNWHSDPSQSDPFAGVVMKYNKVAKTLVRKSKLQPEIFYDEVEAYISQESQTQINEADSHLSDFPTNMNAESQSSAVSIMSPPLVKLSWRQSNRRDELPGWNVPREDRPINELSTRLTRLDDGRNVLGPGPRPPVRKPPPPPPPPKR